MLVTVEVSYMLANMTSGDWGQYKTTKGRGGGESIKSCTLTESESGAEFTKPSLIRCVLCIVWKQRPFVKKQYLGFILTKDRFANAAPESEKNISTR